MAYPAERLDRIRPPPDQSYPVAGFQNAQSHDHIGTEEDVSRRCQSLYVSQNDQNSRASLAVTCCMFPEDGESEVRVETKVRMMMKAGCLKEPKCVSKIAIWYAGFEGRFNPRSHCYNGEMAFWGNLWHPWVMGRRYAEVIH